MPPRATFSKQDVIQAAFDLVDTYGMTGLSARAVAQELDSSTAPVYSNFSTMDELARAVIRKATDLLFEYATTPQTEKVFLNLGVGVVRFAQEHRFLFKALFLESNAYQDIIAELLAAMLEVIDQDERLNSLTREQKQALLTKMSIVTLGYASQICLGFIADTDDHCIVSHLEDIGSCVVEAALVEAGQESRQ
ncbi:MAG: hypothetical protein ABIF77_11620 [bacterium]